MMMTNVDEAVIALAALVLEINCRSEVRGDQVCSLAIRRIGERLAANGDASTMDAALIDVLALSPVNVARRRAIVATAWAGLPAWDD